MTTFVLILLWSSGFRAGSLATVEGYPDREACVIAGREAQTVARGETYFVCIPKGPATK